MKYFIRKLALLILSVCMLYACSDEFYDTETGGRIDPSQHYKSYIDAELSYYGCFVYLQDVAANMVLVDGLRSDLMDVTDNADPDMYALNRHDLDANNPYVDPSSFYKMIININEVLPNLEQITKIDRDFDSTMLVQYTGNLITLRSWAYLMLAKLNGEVGLVDENLGTVDASNPPVYLDKYQIINRLINELLPYFDEEDIFRYTIDQNVLLGELFLEKNDYVNAVKYLKFACDGPGVGSNYKVSTFYEQEAWQEIFLNSVNQSPTVFTAVPYSFVDGQKNLLEEWMNYNYNYMVKPTSKIIEAYQNERQKNDSIGDKYRGKGVTYNQAATGEYFINKYSIDEGVPLSADIILYRAADVHLMLAEALNRLGQPDNALALLNSGFSSLANNRPPQFFRWNFNIGVRQRAYLADKSADGMANKIEYVEDLIMEERAKELAFEGKRFFDLIRVATRRNNPAYLADKVASKFNDPAEAEAIRAKLMDKANWYLPVPKVQGK